MLVQDWLLIGLLAGPATASWAGNLNYRSPSLNHPSLGISLNKVVKRNEVPSDGEVTSFKPEQLNFTHGVASGDPYATSVILWTRAAPSMEASHDNSSVTGAVPIYNPVPIYKSSHGKHISKAPVCLEWKIAKDKKLRHVVDSGTVFTSSDIDYTVKVEATNLEPFTTYYYQFNICRSNNKSPLGRTKTAPRPRDAVKQLSLAVFSCSNFPFGFFNAYGNVARKDSVDYIVHLGDYIYEYKNGHYGWGDSIGRIPKPDKDIYTLYDYRERHATYRTDLDLLELHANFPWIPVWDDHEIADNTYRDGSSELNNTEASFIEDGGISVDQRKMNAVRAYFEWLPIRQVELDDNLRIWRRFQLGDLIDLIMLDTRAYDRSITDLYWNTDYVKEISNDAGRTVMGHRQERWFYRTLIDSKKRGAIWRIIGSQIIFSHLNLSVMMGEENPLNYDAWDGYQANRNRTFKTLYENNIGNNIMIAGDSHANWVSDLVWLDEHRYDDRTGAGSIGVEFAGTAVTSPSSFGQNITMAKSREISEALVKGNRELQWSEGYYRGYFELHVSRKDLTARYYGVPTNLERNPAEVSLANFTVRSGENRLHRPIAGGVVENGFLKYGKVRPTNLTVDTETGEWSVYEL